MKVFHATTAKAARLIHRDGFLDPDCSLTRLKAVWFHVASRQSWAVLHTVKRHGGRVEDVVVFEADVPRSWLRRHARGLWYCTRPVSLRRCRAARGFQEVSA